MVPQVRPVSIRRPRRGLRPSRRGALVLAALVAGATVTGCGIGGPEAEGGLELTSGSEIDDAIGSLWEDGGERALADVVDVEFDQLMVFPEATPAGCVNKAAGTKLLTGKYYQSSTQLFLLRAGGAGVLAAMVSSDVFAHEVQNATFGPEVRIVAPGGKQLITLEG